MLDQSKTELDSASAAERRAAEVIAHRYLTVELVEDLIPEDEAARTIDSHREQNDETWLRAVYAALMGLRAAKAAGFRLDEAGGQR